MAVATPQGILQYYAILNGACGAPPPKEGLAASVITIMSNSTHS